MSVSRFAALAGIAERTYWRRLARHRAGNPVKGPWPAPRVAAIEAAAAKYAADWPAWGHRKIAALMRADGHAVSTSTVQRAAAPRPAVAGGLPGRSPVLGAAALHRVPRPATSPEPGLADRLLRVRDHRGGIWRICAVIDYATKYCLAATVTPTARGRDALACLRRAVAEAQRLTQLADLRGDRGLMDLVDAGGTVIGTRPAPIAVVSDNRPCFRGATFAEAFTGDDPLLRHVRTRVRSPQTNGVVERFFGTLKYEHLYRAIITDGDALAVEATLFRQTYNTQRPHQALADRTPRDAYLAPTDNR